MAVSVWSLCFDRCCIALHFFLDVFHRKTGDRCMSDHMVPGVRLQKMVNFVLWGAVLRHNQRSCHCVYITMIETGSERPSSCYQRNNSCVRHAHMSVMSSCVLN